MIWDGVIAGTWPPVSTRRLGPFTLREGGGGGKRVEAASCEGTPSDEELSAAERAIDGPGRRTLFRVDEGQVAFDRMLSARGYLVLDPTLVLSGPVAPLAGVETPPVSAFTVWPALQLQREIWSEGGIGPARLAVMERVSGPRTSILGRMSDQPAGTAFVALSGDTAMIHAVEIRRAYRRQGLATVMMRHAARWAAGQGADTLSVLVTEANDAAIALYRGLGLEGGRCYHYRLRP